jgi:hypothetical protein
MISSIVIPRLQDLHLTLRLFFEHYAFCFAARQNGLPIDRPALQSFKSKTTYLTRNAVAIRCRIEKKGLAEMTNLRKLSKLTSFVKLSTWIVSGSATEAASYP